MESTGITDGLTKAMKDKGGFIAHMRPCKGNHLDHDLLFGAMPNNLAPSSQSGPIADDLRDRVLQWDEETGWMAGIAR